MKIYGSSSWCELDSSTVPHHESMPHQTFCWCEFINHTVPHQSYPTIGRSASTCRLGSRENRLIADRHRPADRVGPKPRIYRSASSCRSGSDLDPRISRSGPYNDDHPIGLNGKPTLGRLRAESKTMDTRRYRDKRPTSKEPLERLRRSFGPLNKFWRQRIRRRRKNTTLLYQLVHSHTNASLYLFE